MRLAPRQGGRVMAAALAALAALTLLTLCDRLPQVTCDDNPHLTNVLPTPASSVTVTNNSISSRINSETASDDEASTVVPAESRHDSAEEEPDDSVEHIQVDRHDSKKGNAAGGGSEHANSINVEEDDEDVYEIGMGIADITGPAADVNMMGYAKTGQDTTGIHLRQFSRAVIVADKKGNRIVYVTADVAMISQIVKIEVVKALEKKFNGLYTEENFLLSATHTHSGPGGFLQYVLYIVTSQGFISQSFDAIVNGVVRSIERAHSNMVEGYIYWNEGDLLHTSINRSPTGYVNNPETEKSRYQYDTDKQMLLLKFTDRNGTALGMINWFAVHATSMNNTNRLISSDNKGYASLLFEEELNPGHLPGKGPFVAIFSQSNEGDVSPNIRGPRCIDTGMPCDIATSTCGGQRRYQQRSSRYGVTQPRQSSGHVVGERQQNIPAENDPSAPFPPLPQDIPRNEKCIAFGPGRDMFESTRIIAYRQYARAKQLFDSATNKVSGPIVYKHQNVDMSSVIVTLPGNKTASTCKPAMGYSFAAGTIDGPGAFNFHQGDTQTSPFWNIVRDFIRRPSPDLITCQHPKPILIPTGEMNFPYPWQPSILPTQILKIGNFAILALPAEFTTMSGRRIREAVTSEFAQQGQEVKVALAGLANAYSSYVATYDEYQVQRYEAASTIYGPHTLEAYIQQFTNLAKYIMLSETIPPGPQQPNLLGRQISFKPGVIYDGAPFGRRFGDVVHEPAPSYRQGSRVEVTFISGHPRNDLLTEKTFLTVERLDNSTSQWAVVCTDASWETRFIWTRTNTFFGESQATIVWDIPTNTPPGIYRIRHFGNAKNLLQQIKSYVGTSKNFRVVAAARPRRSADSGEQESPLFDAMRTRLGTDHI